MSVVSPDLPSKLSVENMPIFRHHVDVLCSFRIFPSCETFVLRRFDEKKAMNMWHLKYSAITLVTIKIFYYIAGELSWSTGKSRSTYIWPEMWDPNSEIHWIWPYVIESTSMCVILVNLRESWNRVFLSCWMLSQLEFNTKSWLGMTRQLELWNSDIEIIRETEDYGGCSNPLCKIQFPAFLGEFIYSFNFSTSDETPA